MVAYPLGDGDALPQEDAGRPHQPLQHRVSLHRRGLRRVQHVLGVPCAGAWSARAWLPILRVEQASAARGGASRDPLLLLLLLPGGISQPCCTLGSRRSGVLVQLPMAGGCPRAAGHAWPRGRLAGADRGAATGDLRFLWNIWGYAGQARGGGGGVGAAPACIILRIILRSAALLQMWAAAQLLPSPADFLRGHAESPAPTVP